MLPEVEGKVFYSITDLVKMGLMSRTTAWRLINEGELRAVMVGSSARIHRDDLEDFLTSHYNVNKKQA